MRVCHLKFGYDFRWDSCMTFLSQHWSIIYDQMQAKITLMPYTKKTQNTHAKLCYAKIANWLGAMHSEYEFTMCLQYFYSPKFFSWQYLHLFLSATVFNCQLWMDSPKVIMPCLSHNLLNPTVICCGEVFGSWVLENMTQLQAHEMCTLIGCAFFILVT